MSEPRGRRSPLRAALAVGLLCLGVPGQVDWTKRDTGPTTFGPIAYDGQRQRVVMLTSAAGSGETWEWDGVRWTRLFPAKTPPARSLHRMAYDSRRGRVVMYGGTAVVGGSAVYLGDTWEWDGNTWIERTPANSPGPRIFAAMTYDPVRQQVLAFSGSVPPGVFGPNDTWAWDGNDWVQLQPAVSPPARTAAAMAYDPSRDRLVLFGGVGAGGVGRLGDTWEWDGSGWTERLPQNSPAARDQHGMAWDPVRRRVLLFGGVFGPDETWEWDGNDWSQLQPAVRPQRRSGHGMALDEARGQIVVAGGMNPSRPAETWGDTWEWDGSGWTESPRPLPRERKLHDLAYDAGRQVTVLYGGWPFYTDTWEWDGSAWHERRPLNHPPSLENHAMAYHGGTRRVVLFGGSDFGFNTATNATWEWDGVDWTQRAPSRSPPIRTDHDMVYDEARDRIVLFGGRGGSGMGGAGLLADTWEWDGVNWTERHPEDRPSPRYSHRMAYDKRRDRVVLFGGRLSAVTGSTETWEWDGNVWSHRPTEVTPPRTASSTARTAAMTYDHLRGRVVLFDENSSTWEWDGARWTRRPTATAPPTRRQHAIAYDRERDETVLFGGLFVFPGGSYEIADTWVYQTEAPASLEPFGAGCAGSAGTPSLGTAPYEVPWIGARVTWQVDDIPAGSPVLLAFGLSRTQWAGLGLPFSLAVLNAPGCSVLASWDITVPMQTAGTTASFAALMPEEPSLLGIEVYDQAVVLDPPANGLGITVSNATAGTFGYR